MLGRTRLSLAGEPPSWRWIHIPPALKTTLPSGVSQSFIPKWPTIRLNHVTTPVLEACADDLSRKRSPDLTLLELALRGSWGVFYTEPWSTVCSGVWGSQPFRFDGLLFSALFNQECHFVQVWTLNGLGRNDGELNSDALFFTEFLRWTEALCSVLDTVNNSCCKHPALEFNHGECTSIPTINLYINQRHLCVHIQSRGHINNVQYMKNQHRCSNTPGVFLCSRRHPMGVPKFPVVYFSEVAGKRQGRLKNYLSTCQRINVPLICEIVLKSK